MSEDTTHTAPLDDPSDASTSGPRVAGHTASFADPDEPHVSRPAPPPGYELFEEVGRGGMGVVYRARDTKLNRDVAVKFLRPRFPADGIEARRFVQEAQITAQLTHPGVPPVHEVGALPDGRPYIVMKLVKGRTLQKRLRAREPGDRGRLLAVFEQVCQAVGYAHDRGVIHRDLKPSNVMVGSFGEVQVMDWGLAKSLAAAGLVLDPVERHEGIVIRSPRNADAATATGSVLGTPAFMSPEQAGGDHPKIDTRTDVFGLGAVLCAVLTGLPPYVADDDAELCLMAIRGNLGGAVERLRSCGASPEVVALCLRCLAPERDDRPRDANEVAAAVAALRAAAEDRARAAELDRVRLDAQLREHTHRRRVRLAVGGAAAVLLTAAAAVAWWADRQNAKRDAGLREAALGQQLADERLEAERRERRARTAGTVTALLAECETHIRASNLPIAGMVFDQAEQRAAEGGAESLADRLARCRADIVLLRDLDRADQRWPIAAGRPSIGRRATDQLPAALARYGIVPGTTPHDAAAARINGSLVREHLLTALEQWLEWAPSPGVQALLNAADPDPFRDAVRAAHAAGVLNTVDRLAASPVALTQPAWYAAVLGDTLAVPPPRRRLLLLVALDRAPGDYRLLMTLGYLWLVESPAATDEYEKWFRAAVAVRPNSPTAHNYLGLTIGHRDRDGAIREFREAIRLEPAAVGARNNLGNALLGQGDLIGALAEFERALRSDPPYPLAFGNRVVVLELMRDWEGAARAAADWARRDPTNAQAHNRCAWLLATAPDAGARDGRRAVELATRACALSENKDGNHVDTLAAALAEAGQFERAVAEQKRALTYPAFERQYGAAARARIALYEKNQPYRQPPRAPLAPPPREAAPK